MNFLERLLAKETLNPETALNYYPFGSLMPNRQYIGTNYRYGFNDKEKDDEVKGSGNSMDFGARIDDTRLGKWLSPDPQKDISVGISPYTYGIDNPINALDPNGRLVIFFNGMTNGFNGGSSDYWNGVDNKLMSRFHDYHSLYKDGSIGGPLRTLSGLSGGIFSGNLDFRTRILFGFMEGSKDAAKVINSLARDPNDPNKITESIKVVSHSMGTAYSRGYTAAIESYVDQYNKDHKDAPLVGLTFETSVDIASFQGSKLPADKHFKNAVCMTGDRDWVANGGSFSYDGVTGLAGAIMYAFLSPSAVTPKTTVIQTNPETTHSIADYGNDLYIEQIPEGRQQQSITLPSITYSITNVVAPSDEINNVIGKK